MAHVFNDTEKLCTRWGENEWCKKRPKSSREESPALDGFTVGQTLQTQDQYSWRHSTRKFLKWNTGKRQEKSNIISVTIKRDNRKLKRICDGKYLKKMAKILQIWWKLICKKINKSQAEENYATPVFLPGESDGQRSLAGCCPWGHKESDMTEATSVSQSVSQFSRSVVSNSLRPDESQRTRPPCPSPTPRVYSNSCPLSLWCHPAISSSVVPFSSCPQSLPTSGSFPMS